MIIVALAGFYIWQQGMSIETAQEEVDNEEEGAIEEMKDPSEATYSLEDIATHGIEEDCWVAINGKVYDLSHFASVHPGGDSVIEGCGKDATVLFETRPTGSGTPHSENARKTLDEYFIGTLSQ